MRNQTGMVASAIRTPDVVVTTPKGSAEVDDGSRGGGDAEESSGAGAVVAVVIVLLLVGVAGGVFYAWKVKGIALKDQPKAFVAKARVICRAKVMNAPAQPKASLGPRGSASPGDLELAAGDVSGMVDNPVQ